MSGVLGLASTAGRIPAAILALTAAALTAAARFLRSNEHYEIDWTKARAWQALYRSSSAASKGEDSHDIRRLYGIIQSVLTCRTAIMGIGHEPIPEKAILKLPVDDGNRDESARPDQNLRNINPAGKTIHGACRSRSAGRTEQGGNGAGLTRSRQTRLPGRYARCSRSFP
jgi:hypothetical protein